MTLDELNKLSPHALKEQLKKCCGAHNWVEQLALYQPFLDRISLYALAREIWFDRCKKEDWLEAFKHHPKIGDIESLAKKYANTKAISAKEQSGVQGASIQTLQALAKGNQEYEEKYGYIFIVCATGKSAQEMLDLLLTRLHNSPAQEIEIAIQEQFKITTLRLEQLLE